MPIEFKITRAVKLRVVVEALSHRAHAPNHVVAALRHVPVMQHFQTAAAKANGVKGGAVADSAVVESDVDVVPHGCESHAQVCHRERKVRTDVGELMGSSELAMHHSG